MASKIIDCSIDTVQPKNVWKNPFSTSPLTQNGSARIDIFIEYVLAFWFFWWDSIPLDLILKRSIEDFHSRCLDWSDDKSILECHRQVCWQEKFQERIDWFFATICLMTRRNICDMRRNCKKQGNEAAPAILPYSLKPSKAVLSYRWKKLIILCHMRAHLSAELSAMCFD